MSAEDQDWAYTYTCDGETYARFRRVALRASLTGPMVVVALIGALLLVVAGVIWGFWALVFAGVAFPAILLWRLSAQIGRHLAQITKPGETYRSRVRPGVLTVATPGGELEIAHLTLGPPQRAEGCVLWRSRGLVTVLPEEVYPAEAEAVVAQAPHDDADLDRSGDAVASDGASSQAWPHFVEWTPAARRTLLGGVRRVVLFRTRQLVILAVLGGALVVAAITGQWPWVVLLGLALLAVLMLGWMLVTRVGRSLPAAGGAYGARLEASAIVIRTPVSTVSTPYAEIAGMERRNAVILLTRRGSAGSFVFPGELLPDDELAEIRRRCESSDPA